MLQDLLPINAGNGDVVGRLIPLGHLLPPRLLEDPPTIEGVLDRLQEPIEQLTGIVTALHERAEHIADWRSADQLDEMTQFARVHQLAIDTAIAESLLVDLRALVKTGKVALSWN